MEVSGGAEEGFVREWAPCSHILNLIPPRIQTGIFSNELMLTCVDAVNEYIALGTNVGLVYWYDRKKGNIQKLRCEAANSPITYVKIVSTVDYMVGAGNAAGQVTVFQIPKEHPENVPDTFKPKVEPKVERYTIGDLHKGKITAIEWSKNGMRLFSGDNNGIIIMTEIDFYMHLCKSMEIVNEQHEIVQISYYQNTLVVSSMYRSIICERRAGADGRTAWHVTQLGKRDRKRLCAAGAVVRHSYASGSAGALFCARPGLRLWRADRSGDVLQTLIFKEAVSNPLTVAELLNPTQQRHSVSDHELGPLYVFREHFLVSHDDQLLYILDPRSLTAVAVVDQLRRILSVCVNKDEIFILEGPRSLVRLAHAPEPTTLAAEQPINPMTKSLTTSLQHAVNTVRDLTHIEQTVPYITSVLEQPIAMFTKHDTIDNNPVASAEECFELPPIRKLPSDISENVLESIVNEFRDVSDAEEVKRAEELQRKLKVYNSIMARKWDEELIHSRRSRRRDTTSSGGSTPRRTTPVRRDVTYTNSSVMNVSVYGNIEQQDDELLEKQIEEKEKILAKMLNLESLSIAAPQPVPEDNDELPPTQIEIEPVIDFIDLPKPVLTVKKEHKPVDLVPKVVKLPNNWNLEDIELKVDMKNGFIDRVISPDDNLDSEWEII